MHQEGSGVQNAWLCFCNLIVAACEEHGALAEASQLKVRKCSTMRLAFQSPFISQFRATFLLAFLPSSVQLNLVSSAAEWGTAGLQDLLALCSPATPSLCIQWSWWGGQWVSSLPLMEWEFLLWSHSAIWALALISATTCEQHCSSYIWFNVWNASSVSWALTEHFDLGEGIETVFLWCCCASISVAFMELQWNF